MPKLPHMITGGVGPSFLMLWDLRPLGSEQLARDAEVRGGGVMPFTLAIFTAPDVARHRVSPKRASMNGVANDLVTYRESFDGQLR